jgi:hypothetical protein
MKQSVARSHPRILFQRVDISDFPATSVWWVLMCAGSLAVRFFVVLGGVSHSQKRDADQ